MIVRILSFNLTLNNQWGIQKFIDWQINRLDLQFDKYNIQL